MMDPQPPICTGQYCSVESSLVSSSVASCFTPSAVSESFAVRSVYSKSTELLILECPTAVRNGSESCFVMPSSIDHNQFDHSAPPHSFKRQTSLPPVTTTCGSPTNEIAHRTNPISCGVKRPSSLPIPSQVKTIKPQGGITDESQKIPIIGDFVWNSDLTPRGSVPLITNVCQNPCTTWKPVPPAELGLRQPVWAADTAFSSCMLCNQPFSILRRRHHCRACGRVLCSACCNRRTRLPFTNRTRPSCGPFQSHSSILFANRLARVCSECFDILNKTSSGCSKRTGPLQFALPPSLKRQRSTDSPTNQDELQNDSVKNFSDTSSTSFLVIQQAVDIVEFKASKSVDLANAFLMRCDCLLHTVPLPLNQISVRWPPLVVSTHAELTLQYDPPPSLLLSLLTVHNASSGSQTFNNGPDSSVNHLDGDESSDWIPPGITLALTRNIHIHVHPTELRCCGNESAWCFSSRGLEYIGQEEIVFLVQRRPGELLPPLDIYRLYAEIYMSVTGTLDSTTVSDRIFLVPSHIRSTDVPDRKLFFTLDHFFPRSTAVDDHMGCVFFRPSHQCLRGLQLPGTPFLFGSLVHRSEYDCARLLPLRLLLRLGKWAKQYPTPLVSNRDRPPMFDGSVTMGPVNPLKLSSELPASREWDWGTAIIRLCSGTGVSSCVPDSERVSLEILVPDDLQSRLSSYNDNALMNVTMVLLSGRFDSRADSYLVCIQKDELGQSESNYYTEAISVTRADRKVTGCSFVVLSSNALHLHVRIVADGVLVFLTSKQFTGLLEGLKQGHQVCFSDDEPQSTDDSVASSILFRFITREDFCSPSGLYTPQRTSWIDNQRIQDDSTFLVPLHYQLAHWIRCSENNISGNAFQRLAWSKLHFQHSSIPEAQVKDVISACAPLLDDVAGALTEVISPYVAKLRTRNHTRIGLRIRLQPPDRAGFQVASIPHELDDTPLVGAETMSLKDLSNFSEQIDATLLPIVQSWVQQFDGLNIVASENSNLDCSQSNAQNDSVCLIWELQFNILD